MASKKLEQKTVIYQTKSGALELRGDLDKETIWATQAEIAEIFAVNPQAITKHIKNIYSEGELDLKATCSKMEQVRFEGKREVKRTLEIYNLDIIIAVGYRINSVMGTNFRIWATKILREHITRGYTINRKRVAQNYDTFMKAVADVQALLPEHVTLDPKAVLELIKEFAGTWVSLDAYDKEVLELKGVTKKKVTLVGADLLAAIFELKRELMKKGEATDLFASERREGSIEGIVGNVMQSFGGKALYPTAEEKAAHLLYFMVKNHPFSDGNKRSGAFAFVWFLRKVGLKGAKNINPAALTAITLLIAESDPVKKEQMVALVTTMLR
jgi:prophage maintenance system killer protein